MLKEQIVGRGHKHQKQLNSIIRHAEMDCIDSSVGLSNAEYRRAILYTSLSPCDMCAGAILFFGIPNVVIAENKNYCGAEELLRSRGLETIVLNDPQFIEMLCQFDRDHPGIWNKGE